MANWSKSYTVSPCNLTRLRFEIEDDGLTPTYLGATDDHSGSDNVEVWFDAEVTGGEITTLDATLAGHGGAAPTQYDRFCRCCCCVWSELGITAPTVCPDCGGSDIITVVSMPGNMFLDQSVKTTAFPTHTGVQLTPGSAPAHAEGKLFYDSDTKTLVYYNDVSDVALNIGEENWIRVLNKTGGALLNGEVVYIDGAQGDRPTADKAKADAEATATGTIAVVTQASIADNQQGIATPFGLLRSYDTRGFTAGDELFLSAATAGLITKTPPASPNYRIRIGWALNSKEDGDIYVNIKIINHASKVYIDDAGALITATDVEGALQENRGLIDSAVQKALFDANTILKADSDDTPAALVVAEQRIVGRITSGVITALTKAEVLALINVVDGADVTGSNTPQAHKDLHDPEDGADKLDCAVPGAINGNASAEGSAHEFARADHNHQHLATLHENGGGAEISVEGLDGLLAEIQRIRKDVGWSSDKGVDLEVVAGTHRIPIMWAGTPTSITIKSVRAMVGTVPTGATIIIDIHKNGTTIFTTQGNRPTIAISANDSGEVTNMDVTALAKGDYLTLDIDQIGSTIAGKDLVVTLEMEIVP